MQFAADGAQPLIQFALFAGKQFRHLHLNAQIQFAMTPFAEFRQAFPLDAQHRAGLGAGRYGHATKSPKRRVTFLISSCAILDYP